MAPLLPLFPDLLSDELNIVTGLLIGIAFGFVLEQAGFSSSRRLAGLFYGYDFTVLRVFFTAAVTAMSGVLLLGWAGWLDLDAIYVNPTFLGPAILGGVIMGLGFILGGYCPGTSVCAAAIGKKDAIVFVLGGFLGVWVYGEAYPAYSAFANGHGLGPIKVYDSLGVSRGGFALFLVLAAIGAFAATSWIEKIVSQDAPSRAFPVRLHRVAAVGAVAVAVVLFLLPDRKASLLAQAKDPAYQAAHPVHAITADELAFRLLDDDPRLLLIDLRSEDARRKLALPGAVSLPLDGFFTKDAQPLLGRRHATRVLVDEDGAQAAQAAALAARFGYEDLRVLQGGVVELRHSILEFTPSHPPADAAEADTYRFRAEARQGLTARIAAAKMQASKPKPATKKIAGGC
jgi:rhodanese-related sulfurtransferase